MTGRDFAAPLKKERRDSIFAQWRPKSIWERGPPLLAPLLEQTPDVPRRQPPPKNAPPTPRTPNALQFGPHTASATPQHHAQPAHAQEHNPRASHRRRTEKTAQATAAQLPPVRSTSPVWFVDTNELLRAAPARATPPPSYHQHLNATQLRDHRGYLRSVPNVPHFASLERTARRRRGRGASLRDHVSRDNTPITLLFSGTRLAASSSPQPRSSSHSSRSRTNATRQPTTAELSVHARTATSTSRNLPDLQELRDHHTPIPIPITPYAQPRSTHQTKTPNSTANPTNHDPSSPPLPLIQTTLTAPPPTIGLTPDPHKPNPTPSHAPFANLRTKIKTHTRALWDPESPQRKVLRCRADVLWSGPLWGCRCTVCIKRLGLPWDWRTDALGPYHEVPRGGWMARVLGEWSGVGWVGAGGGVREGDEEGAREESFVFDTVRVGCVDA